MSFRLVPTSVTLNDLEWRNGPLRYFTEFGKPALQKAGANIPCLQGTGTDVLGDQNFVPGSSEIRA